MGNEASSRGGGSGDGFYFYDQSSICQSPKRYRKLPEDLPESLRFAHRNPKIAALLASQEREAQRQSELDPFGDGLGKKSLLPNISQAVTHIKNRLDSALSNDEDSQRYLFEDAKASSMNILVQLARYLYFYDDIASHVPRSLEYQLMNGWKELTSDVIYVPREWQTFEIKEMYYNSLQLQGQSEEESDGENTKANTPQTATKGPDSKLKAKKSTSKPTIPDIIEEDANFKPDKPLKRSDSRMSTLSVSKNKLDPKTGRSSRDHRSSIAGFHSPGIRKLDDMISNIAETPSDPRSTALGMVGPAANQLIVSFSLTSKACEEKGWIVQKGRTDEVDKNAILEFCVQLLQEAMKNAKQQQIQEQESGLDKPVIVRYYGDAKREALLRYRKSPIKQQVSSVHKGGKPQIPKVFDDRNEHKQLMQASHLDGTSIVYYPSGRPAVIYSAAGYHLGRPGCYLIAFEDGLDSKMMACFTPMGKGVCYHDNGIVRFLATEKGGHLADTSGCVIRKWKWPLPGCIKNMAPISFQLNNHMVFRCTSQSQMTFVFNAQRETARFNVSPVTGAVEPKQGDENEQLLTNFTFSSRAAKELLRIFTPKPSKKEKSKSKGKKQSKEKMAEIQKLMEFSDKMSFEIEADKELDRLKRKARNLIDDWMEHYRLAIGLKSPTLMSLTESPTFASRQRIVKSAKISESARGESIIVDVDVKKLRAPSAPLVEVEKSSDQEISKQSSLGKSATASVKFDERPPEAGGGEGMEISATAAAVLDRLTQSAGKSSNRSVRTPVSSAPLYRQHTRLEGMSKFPCPISVRQELLGFERPTCRCSHYNIPHVTDIEYDHFINDEVSPSQLIVIAVYSSLFPYANSSNKMLEEIHHNQNRNRTKPCIQGRGDIFRIIKYDINTAADLSDHTQPLLLTRHNVVPGMFLMYYEGKLLFCDHIFNGYGGERKDFKKQVMRSRTDALQGYSLPKDFRFSPGRGRSGMRSAWGGEIGGAGVDKYGSTGTALDSSLMPLIKRPLSSNSGESKEALTSSVGQVRNLDAAKMLSMSLSPSSYHTQDVRRFLSAPPSQRLSGTVR